MSRHDVFISHSSRDATVAQDVCLALESASVACWIAPRDVQPGRPYAGEITRAVERCKALVLVYSSDANQSEQVLREVQLAVNTRVPVVQFRIDRTPLNDDLKFYLGTPHWLDGTNPPTAGELQRLADAVVKLLQVQHPGAAAEVQLLRSHADGENTPELTEATLFTATMALTPPVGSKVEFFQRLRPIIAHFVGENAEDVVSSMQEREAILSTGSGFGLAFPHSYRSYVKRFVIGIVWIPDGCDWDSADGKPVNLVLLYVGGGQARSRQALAIMGQAHKRAISILAPVQDIAADQVLASKVLEAVKSVLVDSGLSFGVVAFG